MSDKIRYTKSSGNVFDDMGFKDSKERLVKNPGTIIGDPDDFIHLDWSSEWKDDHL